MVERAIKRWTCSWREWTGIVQAAGGRFVKGANTIALSPPPDTSVTYSAAILGISNVCYKSEVR